MKTVSMWQKWAKELNAQEKSLHSSLDEGVESILKPKRLLLPERIAKSFEWPDVNLFEDIRRGFSLTGLEEPSEVFPGEVNVPALSMTFLHLIPVFWTILLRL